MNRVFQRVKQVDSVLSADVRRPVRLRSRYRLLGVRSRRQGETGRDRPELRLAVVLRQALLKHRRPFAGIAWYGLLLPVSERRPEEVLTVSCRHDELPSDQIGPARVGRIDRSKLGSIDFGVVGPKRAKNQGVKWAPNTGPLDRGVFVKALPHFNRGYGDGSRPMGHRPQESVTEAPSGHSPSLSEDTLGSFFNGPRPPDPRPKTKAAGSSSAWVGWRGSPSAVGICVFENGSSGNARSSIRRRKSIRASGGSGPGEDVGGQVGHAQLGLPDGGLVGLSRALV
jgi:hypothetical protein